MHYNSCFKKMNFWKLFMLFQNRKVFQLENGCLNDKLKSNPKQNFNIKTNHTSFDRLKWVISIIKIEKNIILMELYVIANDQNLEKWSLTLPE